MNVWSDICIDTFHAHHKVVLKPSKPPAQPAANQSLFFTSNPLPCHTVMAAEVITRPCLNTTHALLPCVPLPFLWCQYITATLTESLRADWKWGGSRGLQPHCTVTEQTAWPTDLQTAEEGADGDLHTATLI